MTYRTNSTLKPGAPLRKRSAKRVQQDKDFAKVRAFVMARDGGCQLARRMNGAIRQAGDWTHRCEGPLDPHHVVSVARDSTLRLDMNNLTVLCRSAHDWVHDHPFEAEALGLLKSAPLLSPQSNQGQR